MILLECPYYDSGHSCEVFYYSSKVGAIQARVGVIEFQGWSNTVPGLEQSSSRVGARRLSKWQSVGPVRGQRRPTLVNPTTLGVGTRGRQRQSRAAPALHDAQSTLVCDRAHDCGKKGLSWVPHYITAGQYDHTDLRLSWELVVWLSWRMFDCLVPDICLHIIHYFLIRVVEFAVLCLRYSSQLSLRLTSCYTSPGFCNNMGARPW